MSVIIKKIQRKVDQKLVAAYCRVSTDHDIQLESFETQERVYKEMITGNPEWKYAGIYADPGISGVSAENRPGFMQMITDAQNKKFNTLFCKNVSRFARNAVETQKYVELLRECGVVVIFEENHLRTDDPSSNFIFALLASVAQDESRSISANIQWSIHQRYAKGEYNFGNNHILGYDSINGELVPNEEAWIVREVFQRFLAGESYSQISDALIQMGAQTKRRKSGFAGATLQGMLKNETYIGDIRLQQAAPRDYLTKKPDTTVNYRSYYIENDHEALIDKATWEKVQAEFKRRERDHEKGIVTGKHHPLYGKIFCGCCGAPYVRRTLRTKGGATRKAWSCRDRVNGKGCAGRVVWEDELEKYVDDENIIITESGVEIRRRSSEKGRLNIELSNKNLE